ncbi:MAG TPA: DUF969 domain-containing protein [Allosphingosinicella sp.]|jgi:uncharacterized membrane protein|nr:DUF969 domain-containing protein [Allosphingosinicella sp.]
MTNYFVLLGILIVVAGFALRLNPMLVVTAAAIATGLIAGMDLVEVVSTFGKAFNDNRIIAIVWIVLPVIGLLERYGLQQRAAALIRGFRSATTGRLLILYLGYRQIISAVGLHSTAGHPQTVRPLLAPMALAAAEKQHGELDEATSERVKAYSAATDNVGLFFGEDIFFAIASIVLIQQTLATYGIVLAPLQLGLWAIPSAIAAFLVHGSRLLMLDRGLSSPRRSRGEGDPAQHGGGVTDQAPPNAPPPPYGRPPSPFDDGEAKR